ncbi:MAG: hypothetical protein KJ726_06350 [Verrucomicrobia bacterium]|nr:hypothetical protein [Verrucomicrobiota bacterium]MBU1909647.1 hypothetical protein [Verrucomicrobiota bacterium]
MNSLRLFLSLGCIGILVTGSFAALLDDPGIIHYVSTNGLHQTPYTNWVMAATNIQAAVNAASDGATVLVTDGVYAAGGELTPGADSLTSRVVIAKAITVQSVNGPSNTFIVGAADPTTTNGPNAVRCVYMTNSSMLIGFTLTNGHTRTTAGSDCDGGGVWCETNAVVSNCLLIGNTASDDGGGAYGGLLFQCVLVGNVAPYGGGAGFYATIGTLDHCTLSGNSATEGGGSYEGTLNNCTLSGNSATYGGGSCAGDLDNCVLYTNSAQYGGGSFWGTLNDCTLSGNFANVSGGGSYAGTLNSCTLSGNSATYGGGSYLGSLNNCAFSNNVAASMGGGSYTGTLDNCALYSNSAQYGGGSAWSALVGCTLAGNSATNGGGSYAGTLNHCTLSDNSAGAGGGSFWSILNDCTLSGNSATNGGGSYAGTLNHCALSNNVAVIGGGAFDATLNDCTLSGNSATNGGGTYAGTLNHCILSCNSADAGGGSYLGSLNNCAFSGNSADVGGGSFWSTLNDCTLSGNSADDGGGSYAGSLTNCIVYYNIAATADSNYVGGTLAYCCAAPLPGGAGNIADPPRFLDVAASNYHLTYGSPCIDSGTNLAPAITNDIEGTLRPLDGNFDSIAAFDIGAYEYNPTAADSDGDTMRDDWEHRYGLNPTNPADANIDSDIDTVLNKDEHTADTVPTNAESFFCIEVVFTNACAISFDCSTARVYSLYQRAELLADDWSGVEGKTNLPGDAGGGLSLTDTNEADHRAYRVGVKLP